MPIRVACIGCGFIARIHMLNARKIPELFVVAFCDGRENIAKQFCTEFGGQYYTTDSSRIFKDASIDAILICTWHDSHVPLALQAAAAGKHILMEKPLAMNTSDCLKIEEAVEKAGVKLTVDFKFRYAPTVARAKDRIKNPHLVVGQSVSDRPDAADSWVLNERTGGGLLLAGGCHNFDLICYLADSEPTRIHAEGGKFIFPQSPYADNVVGTINFQNGAIGTFIQGMGRKSGYASSWLFELFGATETATLHDHCRQLQISAGVEEKFSIQEENPDGDAVGTEELLRAFARCILDGHAPSPDVRDGTRATHLVEKAVESMRTGNPQPIDMSRL